MLADGSGLQLSTIKDMALTLALTLPTIIIGPTCVTLRHVFWVSKGATDNAPVRVAGKACLE
jgi:hypothetical protein